jgi:hypothetical protein
MERGCRKVISLATFVFYRDIVHFDGATESKGFEEEGEEEEEEDESSMPGVDLEM